MSTSAAQSGYDRASQLFGARVAVKPVTLVLPKAHPKQFELITALDNDPGLRFIVGACGTKFGKALALDTPIPTPDGWKMMGELKVGDLVFDDAGQPTVVEYVTEPMFNHTCYYVVFSDGSAITADAEHLWVTSSLLERKKQSRRKSETAPESYVTTEEIKASLLYGTRHNHSVKTCAPLEYNTKDLPIHPYVLGVWLGDGTSCTGVVTIDDEEILAHLREAGFGSHLPESAIREWRVEGLTKQLRLLGVLENKHVPELYLRGSVQQRLQLLQGLMDTDGTISKRGHCSFDNTNVLLAAAVRELCHSLGIKTTCGTKLAKLNGECKGVCYRVFFTTDLPVFRLARKAARLRKISSRMSRRMIVAVQERESVPVRCIRVASPRHMFLAGKACIPTHNTYGSTIALVKEAWNKKGSLNWWVSPTYAQSKMAWSLVTRLLPEGTYDPYKADLKLVIKEPNGSERSTIEFKSGDNPDSLRGFGVNFFVMDEAARCPYDSFVSIMTTVTQTFGKGFFISTPHARNWFYDVYRRGEKADDDGTPLYGPDNPDPFPEWYAIRMPTWSNPWVRDEAIEQMRRNMPEDVFQQEVAAKFLSDSAGVFRGIKECIRGSLQKPAPGGLYVMGVDLGRLKDYTVLTVMDRRTKHVVYFERFNKISWDLQYYRIVETARKYNNALVCMDSTGLGDPIVETIQNAGVRVEPYKISGTVAKQQLIDKLRVNIEKQRISFPVIPVMKRELESYEYKVTESGVVKFSAPTGYHDDCVISLALANWVGDTDPFIYRAFSARGI